MLPEDRQEFLAQTTESLELNFLTLVLSFILLNGRELPQNLLKTRLSELGINMDGEHEELGSVPDLLQKFVRQLYLDQFKPDAMDDKVSYVWGKRSKVIFTEDSVIDFIVDVPNINRCTSWIQMGKRRIWLKPFERLLMVFNKLHSCVATFFTKRWNAVT